MKFRLEAEEVPSNASIHFRLFHSRWSLVGSGASFENAYNDLIGDIRNAIREYGEIPDANLTNDAIEFKKELLACRIDA